MSKFHRMVEMWSVELWGDSVQSHQCVSPRYPLIACVFGGKGAIMCWVTWGLLIGSNPRCFEFTLNPKPNMRGVIRLRPTLCNGVKANVQLKSSIPIGAKVEISSQGLSTRSQG